MSELEGARCVGQWWLFESVDLRDHLAAAEICAGCPVTEACEAILESCRSSQHGAGPVGTWNGKLYGKSGGQVRDFGCGTDSGYYRHRHLGEESCDGCLQAHAAARKVRRKTKAS